MDFPFSFLKKQYQGFGQSGVVQTHSDRFFLNTRPFVTATPPDLPS
jgi:hypothetical protein